MTEEDMEVLKNARIIIDRKIAELEGKISGLKNALEIIKAYDAEESELEPEDDPTRTKLP